LRDEQRVFRDLCTTALMPHLVGGVNEVVTFLVRGGWLKADNVPHYRRPAAEVQP
jgi:hypothetical protein